MPESVDEEATDWDDVEAPWDVEALRLKNWKRTCESSEGICMLEFAMSTSERPWSLGVQIMARVVRRSLEI